MKKESGEKRGITIVCSCEKVKSFDIRFEPEMDFKSGKTIESVAKDIVLNGDLGEAFWELICEFDEDLGKAVEISEHKGIPLREAIVSHFGNFSMSYYYNDDFHNWIALDIKDLNDEFLSLLEDAAPWFL